MPCTYQCARSFTDQRAVSRNFRIFFRCPSDLGYIIHLIFDNCVKTAKKMCENIPKNTLQKVKNLL